MDLGRSKRPGDERDPRFVRPSDETIVEMRRDQEPCSSFHGCSGQGEAGDRPGANEEVGASQLSKSRDAAFLLHGHLEHTDASTRQGFREGRGSFRGQPAGDRNDSLLAYRGGQITIGQ
jgi:hypothetical protein